MQKRIHFEGQVFGRLEIKKAYHAKENGRWRHLVQCDCGNSKIVAGDDMRRGKISSCGCLRQELKTTHNMSHSSEYHVWASMIQRCTNPNSKYYKNYGGRGITICNEWLKFDCFISDMGMKSKNNLTIERLDNNKGYNKSNCVWASREEQSLNQRIRIDNKTGVRGVSYSNKKRKYLANIQRGGQRVNLGWFNDLSEAIDARKKAEITHLNKTEGK